MPITNLLYLYIHIIYNNFDIFLKNINIYIVIKRFVFIIKYSKKSKKKILYKIWLKYNKHKLYKVEKYKK